MIKSLDRTGTWRTYSMADGLAGMRIEHIAEDSEGYLWFATWDNGVSRFDGDEFQNFTHQDGLVGDSVYLVSQDSQNRLWFGTLNGVCWYDGSDFHHLEDEGIAGRAVQCIYEDREGRIWCVGHRTLGYYDGTCVPRSDAALPSTLRSAASSLLAQPVSGHCPGQGRPHVVWL